MGGFRQAFAKFLSVQMITLISGLVLLFMLVCALLDIRADRQRMLAGIEARAGEVGGLLRLAVEKPIFLGDDPGTAAEFARLAEKYPELALSVAGFNGNVTYSTRPEEVRGRLEELFPLEIAEKYQAALQGIKVAGSLVEEGGRRKYLVFSVFENQPDCYHCHGWSQPVIGAMAFMLDVDDELGDFTLASLGGVLNALLGAALLSLLLFLVIRLRVIGRILTLGEATAGIVAGENGAVIPPGGRTAPTPDAGPNRTTLNEPGPVEAASAGSGPDEIGRIGSDLDAIRGILHARKLHGAALEGLNVPAVLCGNDFRIILVTRPLLLLLEKPGRPQDYAGCGLDEFLYGSGMERAVYREALREGEAAREEDFKLASGRALKLRLDSTRIYPSRSFEVEPPGETAAEKFPSGVFTRVEDVTVMRSRLTALRDVKRGMNEGVLRAARLVDRLAETSSALAGQIGHTRRQAEKYQSGVSAAVDHAVALKRVLLETAAHGTDVSDLADDLGRTAASGAEFFVRAGRVLKQAGETSDRLRVRMRSLDSQADEVRRVLQVIRDIAAQANLLALNAVIEADLRGEAGRNFSLLAAEVRALSEKTVEAGVSVDGFLGAIELAARHNLAEAEDAAARAGSETERFTASAESLKRMLDLSVSLSVKAGALNAELERQAKSGETVSLCLEEQRNASHQTVLALAASEDGVFRLSEICARLDEQLKELHGVCGRVEPGEPEGEGA